MKIMHVCLAAVYIDNFSYQENVMPRMHKNQNNEVKILASTEVLNIQNKHEYVLSSSYMSEDGIPVTRLPYVKWLPDRLRRKLRIYSGVREELEKFKPQIIFLHDIQFLSAYQIRKYAIRNPEVKIVADGHADYINSARGFVSKHILHGMIYRHAAKVLLPYVQKFYGTLPSRVVFMKEMYRIPEDKLAFLPMGVDDVIVQEVLEDGSREQIRKKMGFSDDDIVLVTGGKIDKNKRAVLELMEAVKDCANNVKLLIFGAVDISLHEEFNKRLIQDKVVMYGWANEKESYQLLNSADVAVFPCLHSTLWEQSAGMGLPCILHEIEGFKHINIRENCVFVENCDATHLLKAIEYTIANFEMLKKNAESVKKVFSYNDIAKRVLDNIE